MYTYIHTHIMYVCIHTHIYPNKIDYSTHTATNKSIFISLIT